MSYNQSNSNNQSNSHNRPEVKGSKPIIHTNGTPNHQQVKTIPNSKK